LVALEKSGGKYTNVAQIPEVKAKVTAKGNRHFQTVDTSGENNPMYGRKHSEETKRLQRIRRLDSLKLRHNVYPAYNPSSIMIIEQYGKEHGYEFQHAENGGEYYIEYLGYYIDGYDAKQNVVIEYDELHHYDKDGKLRAKDIKRQQEIEEFLKCKFIRIKQKILK